MRTLIVMRHAKSSWSTNTGLVLVSSLSGDWSDVGHTAGTLQRFDVPRPLIG